MCVNPNPWTQCTKHPTKNSFFWYARHGFLALPVNNCELETVFSTATNGIKMKTARKVKQGPAPCPCPIAAEPLGIISPLSPGYSEAIRSLK